MILHYPSGVARVLAKMPLVFYRFGLGRLLGTRFVQITHRGRKSGLLHQTVVEVLRYDSNSKEIVVVSGWGGKTDWYRNLQQEPALEVRSGRVVYRPIQQFLSPGETSTEVLTVFQQHPQEARLLGPLLGIDPAASKPIQRTQIETVLRGVRFQPVQRT